MMGDNWNECKTCLNNGKCQNQFAERPCGIVGSNELRTLLKRKEQECNEIKEHYEQQLEAMCNKYNELLEKTNKESSSYMSEIGVLRHKLNTAKKALKIMAKSTKDMYPYGGDKPTWYAIEAQKILKELNDKKSNKF